VGETGETIPRPRPPAWYDEVLGNPFFKVLLILVVLANVLSWIES